MTLLFLDAQNHHLNWNKPGRLEIIKGAFLDASEVLSWERAQGACNVVGGLWKMKAGVVGASNVCGSDSEGGVRR